MSPTTYVVTGAGPVGATVALQLAEQGHHVRLLTRSGSGPEHPSIERLQVDVSRADVLGEHVAGAAAVFHCIHGSAYTAKAWREELPKAEQVVLDAAGRAGAVAVFPESLYSYGRVAGVMTEDTPRHATEGKLGVRADLLRAREASPARTVSVVASDFLGPRVKMSHAGERIVPKVIAGKTISVVGSLDQPHSFTYVPDLARAMVRAAQTPELWDRVLHAPTAPALTQRELVTAMARAAGVQVPRMWALPAWVLRVLGLVSVDSRELYETSYQFTAPFVMDSARSEDLLGLHPTPMDVAVKETVAWWQVPAASQAGV